MEIFLKFEVFLFYFLTSNFQDAKKHVLQSKSIDWFLYDGNFRV